MCKKLMALHVLELIEQSLQETLKRSERIADADDFLVSETGVILLDSICMKLSAIGESVKNLDKINYGTQIAFWISRNPLERCNGNSRFHSPSLL